MVIIILPIKRAIKNLIAHIMNTQNDNYLKIWIGLAKVRSQNKDLLQGAKNAYVQVIGRSDNKKIFRDKVADALDKMNMELIRMEEAEPFNERIKKFKIDSSLFKIANDISDNKSEISFGTFHAYD
jgi:hypothetical protein